MRLWKRLQAALPRLGIAGLVIALIAGIIAVAYFAGIFPDWTGLPPGAVDAQGHELPRAKTLWDWLGLLLVPLVLAVGGYFLTRSENRHALKLQERREEEARKLERERAQDAALQAYLDQMTQLLLHEKLRTSQPDDEVRSVARARTLTVLRILDGVRKGVVLQFLYEAKLIGRIKKEQVDGFETIDAIVRLEGASLERAYLEWAGLRGAHLRAAHLEGANLENAKLDGANLERANLDRANLYAAHLEGANLREAHLEGASLVGANLREAHLREAHLREAHLREAHLERADLREADLKKADLREADLREADLREANLFGAGIEGADLTNCDVTREQLAQAASLEGAKLPFDMAPRAPSVEVSTPKDQVTTREPK